jgi:molybdenum cofactor cytidylyltransferase
MKFGPISVETAAGAILAHSVTAGEKTWRKATVLTAEDTAAIRASGIDSVTVAQLEPGDLDENAAATLVATALSAPGIEIRAAATGRVNLHAVDAGVFTVKREAVNAINAVDPAITLATLPEYAAVTAGQMIATVKIIPFAVSDQLARKAAQVAADIDVLALHPFRARRTGLIQTLLPSVKASVLDKTARLAAERLARSDSVVTDELRISHQSEELAAAIAQMAGNNDLVVVFGASAVADADDVIPAAIRLAGGTVTRVGMPVDPGNLLVLGEVAGKTVIGAPGCARSPKLNGFDWVLDRMLAGLHIGDREIASMGVGGLLMEIPTRPQPREPRTRVPTSVYAVLLAAGRGQRMGGPNKLMADFSGTPLIRQVADVMVASRLRATVAVVGHQSQRVQAALAGSGVRLVENPDYVTGLASSLKAGVRALPPDAGGALIALGDMPGVTAKDVDRLVDAFLEARGTSIVRATHGGKRGNPVVLPASLFGDVMELAGDTGARHLVETSDLPIIDVEIGEAASLDVDTPEAMAQAGGVLAG